MRNRCCAMVLAISFTLIYCASAIARVNNDSSSLMWSKPVEVKRVDKPKRTPPKPRPKPTKKKPVVVEKIQLLSLRWSVNKGDWADAPDPSKNPKPSNPEESYKVNDHLQLVFTVNQDGYLYIVQEKDLTMVFPDKRINNGQNFVKKDQQIVIPSNCANEYKDKNGNCWFRVENSDDDLTLIFSRDKIDDLPNSANDEGTVIVKKDVLAEVKSGSRQQFSKTNPNGTTVQFTNLNRSDNEELIIETKIRHQ
jgi:Domain of unknown function (DUF4384)